MLRMHLKLLLRLLILMLLKKILLILHMIILIRRVGHLRLPCINVTKFHLCISIRKLLLLCLVWEKILVRQDSYILLCW